MTEQDQFLPASLFAEYMPRVAGKPRPEPLGLVIRRAVREDRDALARIRAERDGGSVTAYVQRFERDLSNHGNRPDDLWLAAEVDGRVVGYGKVAYLQPPPDSPPNAAPAGFYLGGVTVARAFRRRGIAHELTLRRLQWIARRAEEAYYFANAQNRASIDLHARFGFTEITRDFVVPGVSFTGGVGILFRAKLDAFRATVLDGLG
jgi:GNAT superfamily N-acetyltransferase